MSNTPTPFEALYALLQPAMHAQGYVPVPALKQFRKNTDFGFLNVVLNVSTYETESIVDLHLGVRHNRVENLMYAFSNGLPGFRPDSNTLLSPLTRIFNNPAHRYTIANNTAAFEQLADTLNTLMLAKGWAFMEQISKLRQLHLLFNTKPETPLALVFNAYHRVLRGLTIAHLVRAPELPDLFEVYHQITEQQIGIPEYTKRFERLYQYLQQLVEN